uniref:Cytochrome b5 domain containing 2 n=1 Tax=Gopherus evgoodei TaxID=1825980 RepID=A0A8C4W0K5_9SAUR
NNQRQPTAVFFFRRATVKREKRRKNSGKCNCPRAKWRLNAAWKKRGKDASRAFATGDFTNTGLVDDVSGLSPSEILTIQNWLSFYSENYIFVGKLVGRFYDENGAPTKALEQAKAVIEEALKFKEQNNEKKQFPPCNSEWSSTSGSRFWCSKQSGGVNRDWIGVPRKLYKPGSSDSHCVCVRTIGPPSGQLDSTEHSDRGDLDNPNLQEYKGCHPLADCIRFV